MIRTQVLKHLPGAREGEREGSKRYVRKGVMEKSSYVRVIEGEGVKKDGPIKISSPRGRKYLLSPKGDDGN